MTFSFPWMQWMLINKIVLIKYLRAWDWSCSKLDGLTSSQCSRSGLKSVWIFCQKVFNPGYWSQEWLHCLDQGDFEPPKKHLSPTYPFLNNSAPKIWLWHCYLLKKHPLDPKDLLLFKKLLQSNTTGEHQNPPKPCSFFLKKQIFTQNVVGFLCSSCETAAPKLQHQGRWGSCGSGGYNDSNENIRAENCI